jgi:taurine transport system permease protein
VSETDPKDGAGPAVDPPAASKAPDKPKPKRIEDILPKAQAKSPQELGYPGPPPQWWRTLREDPPYYLRLAIGGAFIGFLILLWWLVTRGDDPIVPPTMLPSPGATAREAPGLLDRNVDDHLFATLRRVCIGIGLAAVVGVGGGIVAGSIRGVAAALNPVVLFLRSVPMGALGPLTLAMFGTDEKQKWMFIFIAVVPFVFSDTVKAISSVPQRYVETAETLGASKWQVLYKVLLPLGLPDIVTSLRFQFGLALGYLVLAETTGIIAREGIGGMFAANDRQGLYEHTWGLLFLLAFVAFFIDITIRYLQRAAFPYRKDL